MVLRKNQVRIQGGFSICSQEERGKGVQETQPWFSGGISEDSRGVQHRQSGRTRQRSPVDPLLGFKEEPGLKGQCHEIFCFRFFS